MRRFLLPVFHWIQAWIALVVVTCVREVCKLLICFWADRYRSLVNCVFATCVREVCVLAAPRCAARGRGGYICS